MTFPNRPSAFQYVGLFQVPARRSATLSAIRRSIARSSPIVSSATAIALRPGTFVT